MRARNVPAGGDETVVKSRPLAEKQPAVGGSGLVKQGKTRVMTRSGARRHALEDVSNVPAKRNSRNAKGKTANCISKRPGPKPTRAGLVAARAVVAAAENATTNNAAADESHIQRGTATVDTKVHPPQDWQDPDEDLLCCVEYSPEIFRHLKELEHGMKPNPAYCEQQQEMTDTMRDVLVDWMIEVHHSFKMIPETLYLAIHILNCYLSLMQVSSNMLQLAAITALFIAAKVEEIACPGIRQFAFMADNAYRPEDIRRAERHMLKALNFGLSYPNPMNFLRRISRADDYDTLSRTIGKYLLEIAVVDHRFMRFPPSLLAAGAMYLSRHILKMGDWDPLLEHYAGYTEEQLKPVVSLLVDYIGAPVHETLFKKYAGKNFSMASIIVRDWYAGCDHMDYTT